MLTPDQARQARAYRRLLFGTPVVVVLWVIAWLLDRRGLHLIFAALFAALAVTAFVKLKRLERRR